MDFRRYALRPVVNTFVMDALSKGVITITTVVNVAPLVDVRDAARATLHS
jgi:hypothetical protein